MNLLLCEGTICWRLARRLFIVYGPAALRAPPWQVPLGVVTRTKFNSRKLPQLQLEEGLKQLL